MGVETGCIWMYLKGNWLYRRDIFFTSMFPGRKGSTCVCPEKTSPGCRPRCWILVRKATPDGTPRTPHGRFEIQVLNDDDKWIDGWVGFSIILKLGNEKIKYINLGRFEGSFWVLEWCCCDVLGWKLSSQRDVSFLTQKPHLSSTILQRQPSVCTMRQGERAWCLNSSGRENQRMQMLLLMVQKSSVYQLRLVVYLSHYFQVVQDFFHQQDDSFLWFISPLVVHCLKCYNGPCIYIDYVVLTGIQVGVISMFLDGKWKILKFPDFRLSGFIGNIREKPWKT